jgi:membrane protease YdiL (CAAX protease family)
MEYAFRGYLLPKLSPLGKWFSVALAAAGPFLYGVPFVVYSHVVAPEALDDLPESLFRLFAITFSSGLLLGILWNHTRHLGLIAILAGSIVAHVYGIWDSLFAMQHYWFTGSTGLIAAILWGLLAAYPKAFVNLPREVRTEL